MTLSSMTGFARREGAHGDWAWAVEARSVNGRNLDVRFRGPSGLDALERLGREATQARFQRGQVSISVQGRRSSIPTRPRINADVLDLYLAFSRSLVEDGRAAPPGLDGLLALPGVVELADAEEDAAARSELEAAIAATIGDALDDLRRSRRLEGAAIHTVLSDLLDRIEALLGSAEAEAAAQPALVKARFQRRLVELVGEAAAEDRIVQEAAAMAVKADVREELDRLAGHVTAARALLVQHGAAGRRLDFLTQEFMREANTLCSKSASMALTTAGLELKAVIDQLREQIQNVE